MREGKIKMDKEFLNLLDEWHENSEFQKIIDAILPLPEHELDYDLTGHLARAYNNSDKYEKAIETLIRVKEQGQHDARWLFRLGYAYFYQGRNKEALQVFTQCKEINPDEPNIDVFLKMLLEQDEDKDGDYNPQQEYWELYLEKIDMPVSGEPWKNDIAPAFYFDISDSGTGKCYEIAFSPFEDEGEKLQGLNRLVEQKGFEANGCGWENFFRDHIVTDNPGLSVKITGDSDYDTCRLTAKNKKDYYALLGILSKAVRDLYVCDPKAKLPEEFEYVKDMFNDNYYPKNLVEQVKKLLQKVAVFIEGGKHTYEEIQQKFDEATEMINNLQEKFEEQNSEIETIARDSIGETVAGILEFYNIDIDVETAIRERDW